MNDSGISRRDALQVMAGAVGLAAGWRAVAGAAVTADPFRFVQVNDLHAMSPECPAWLERAVSRMRQDAPAFALLCGDLTEWGDRGNMEVVRSAFERLGAPVHAVPGNHDYAAASDRSAYDAAFPGSLNRVVGHGGWRFVGLDTTEGQKFEQTRISAETLAWMEENRPAWSDGMPTVVFTHFPLGEGVRYRPLNADEALSRLAGVNLVAVFSGHFHGLTERKVGATVLTTDRCCALKRSNHDGTTEKGYFLCEAGPAGLRRTFVPVTPD